MYQIDTQNYLEEMIFNEPSNKIFMRTKDFKMLELDMNVKLIEEWQRDYHKSQLISVKDNNDLGNELDDIDYSTFSLQIMRQFLHSKRVDEKMACLKFID